MIQVPCWKYSIWKYRLNNAETGSNTIGSGDIPSIEASNCLAIVSRLLL